MWSVYSQGQWPTEQFYNNKVDAERRKWELIGAGYSAFMNEVKEKK